MSVDKELWLPIIEKNFFTKWDVLTKIAKDDSGNVITAGNTFAKVHIPNAGSAQDVAIDNTTYPVSVETRTDTTVEYDIHSFQMPPVRVGDFEDAKNSYNKRMSVVEDAMGGIGETVLYTILEGFYPGKNTDQYVETSGFINMDASGLVETGEATDATGDRLILTHRDVRDAAKILDKQKMPESDRFLLLPASMFYQLHDSLTEKFEIVDNDGLAMFNRLFYNFNVIKLPKVLRVTSAGSTVRSYGAGGASTDHEVGFALHKSGLSVAKGGIKVFDGTDLPEYYGDIISAEAWAGGKYRRTDKNGIVPIIQDTP